MVLQVHQFVGDDRVEFVFLQDAQETPREEHAPVLSPDRHGEGIVRFDDEDSHVGDTFELAEKIHVRLEGRFTVLQNPRGELPNHRRIPVAPNQEGNDRRCD